MIVYGFVRAILSRDPRHTDSPLLVEIYSPKAKPGERTKKFSLEKLTDNRELVLVSLLRDALIHSLPVELGCDDAGRVDHVEIRTSTDYNEWDVSTLKGKVLMISLSESGIGSQNWDNPDLARILISKSESLQDNVELYLNLQRAERGTKLAQLSLLQSAFEKQWAVTVKYYTQPVEGSEPRKVIIEVKVGVEPGKIIQAPHEPEIPGKIEIPKSTPVDWINK